MEIRDAQPCRDVLRVLAVFASVLVLIYLNVLFKRCSPRTQGLCKCISYAVVSHCNIRSFLRAAIWREPSERHVYEILDAGRVKRAMVIARWFNPMMILYIMAMVIKHQVRGLWIDSVDVKQQSTWTEEGEWNTCIELTWLEYPVLLALAFFSVLGEAFPRLITTATLDGSFVCLIVLLQSRLPWYEVYPTYLYHAGGWILGSRLLLSIAVGNPRLVAITNFMAAIFDIIQQKRFEPHTYAHKYWLSVLYLLVIIVSISCIAEKWTKSEIRASMKVEAVQEELRIEKDASLSLLKSMCDAIFWVAHDLSTVSHSDLRFNNLMGKNMQGAILRDHVTNDEWTRLQNSFAQASQLEHDFATVLSTTLLNASLRNVDADLYVVDQHRRGESTDGLLGFVVGLSLAKNFTGDELPAFEVAAPLRADAEELEESVIGRNGALQPVPVMLRQSTEPEFWHSASVAPFMLGQPTAQDDIYDGHAAKKKETTSSGSSSRPSSKKSMTIYTEHPAKMKEIKNSSSSSSSPRKTSMTIGDDDGASAVTFQTTPSCMLTNAAKAVWKPTPANAERTPDLSSLVSSSLAFSGSTTSSGLSHVRSNVSEKGAGTSPVAVQTEPLLVAEVAVQAGAYLPPIIPPLAAQQGRRPKVCLRTRKLALPHLKETPRDTIVQVLCQNIARMNLRGKGCCYMHIGLAVLQQTISTIASGQCNQSMKPHSGFQCMHCFALNEEDEDEECCVCHEVLSEDSSEEAQEDPSEDAQEAQEADEADVESPSASDSDTLVDPA